VTIHAAAAGPQESPVVFLLHGFPEFWYGWRGQIAPLASAGFRVVVVFGEYARTHPAQLLRSWYILFMQLPRLPEFLFEAQNFRAMTEALTKSSRPGTFSEQDLTAYREAWRKPGAPTAMINWYRALRHPAIS
jgi:hypothetical protein